MLDRVLSREGHAATAAPEGSLAYGFLPITVAGPRPILTAFPASRACKIILSVYGGPTECVNETQPASVLVAFLRTSSLQRFFVGAQHCCAPSRHNPSVLPFLV
jgi:hypothetical protein